MFDIFSFLSLLGGIAMFLFGMMTLSGGLRKFSGGKAQKYLSKLTDNPVKGFFLGVGVTAVIQSSSASAVLLVGFVNSGIMRLSQAMGVILGTDVGTTVTAWIISFIGLSGDGGGGTLSKLMNPMTFVPVLAVIGVVLLMFVRGGGRAKRIGNLCVGFAILMIGLQTMTAASAPLGEMAWFRNVLLAFSNPLFGVLAGALLAAAIQSSSAAVGILQALSSTGAVMLSSATPIVLGQNIGTCITALLSSVGANKNAKRVAVTYLYFNIIGTAVFLTFVYALNALIEIPGWDGPVNAVGIAAVHTTFNVSTAALALPFTKQLEKLARFTVRDAKEEDSGDNVLDDRLLNTPQIAIERCKQSVVYMAKLARDNILLAMKAVADFDEDAVRRVYENEELIDRLEDTLGNYLVKLTGRDISKAESRAATRMLHALNDIERIGDHAENLAENAARMNEANAAFSESARADLELLEGAVREILDMGVAVLESESIEDAKNIEPLEETIDMTRDAMRGRHIERLKSGECTIDAGVFFLDILQNYERVADHCSNLAVSVIGKDADDYNQHGYLKSISEGKAPGFNEKLERYKAKYFYKITE